VGRVRGGMGTGNWNDVMLTYMYTAGSGAGMDN